MPLLDKNYAVSKKDNTKNSRGLFFKSVWVVALERDRLETPIEDVKEHGQR